MTEMTQSYTKHEFAWESGLDPATIGIFEKLGYIKKIRPAESEYYDRCYSARDLELVLKMTGLLKEHIVADKKINLRTAYHRAMEEMELE